MTKVFDYFNRPESPSLKFDDVSMTQQQFKEDCDINHICETYGDVDCLMSFGSMSGVQPTFGDFTKVADFQEMQDNMVNIKATFESLPARIRAEFLNDVGNFVEFCSNADNISTMVEMGIIDKNELPPIQSVDVVSDPVNSDNSDVSISDVSPSD